jgi:hypothetical protein
MLIRLFVWEHCWLLGFLRPVQLFKHSRRCEKRKMKWDTTLMFKTFHVTAHILGSTCQREQVKLSFKGGRRRFLMDCFSSACVYKIYTKTDPTNETESLTGMHHVPQIGRMPIEYSLFFSVRDVC